MAKLIKLGHSQGVAPSVDGGEQAGVEIRGDLEVRTRLAESLRDVHRVVAQIARGVVVRHVIGEALEGRRLPIDDGGEVVEKLFVGAFGGHRRAPEERRTSRSRARARLARLRAVASPVAITSPTSR